MNILLVDNNVGDVGLFREAVKRSGRACSVEVVTDGDNALHKLRERRYDLLILDLELPRMDGFQLLEKMRSEKLAPVSGIVIFTGHATIDSERARELGVTQFVRKPQDWDSFLAAVEQMLDQTLATL